MSSLLQSTTALAKSEADDPFRYGWRYVRRVLLDGRETLDQVPLTLDDVLHPEEGDFIVKTFQHQTECSYLSYVLREHLGAVPTALVLSDHRVDWGRPEIGVHGPDIVVFFDLQHPHDPFQGTFYVQKTGCRIGFAIEIVSPNTRSNDVEDKLAHYHQIGVPLYVIVEQKQVGGARTLLPYQHTPGNYVLQPLTTAGRFALPGTGLLIGLEQDEVTLYDAQTQQKIGHYSQVVRARQQEAAARLAAEQRAQQAEQHAQQEAAARLAAEQRAEAERQERQTLEARLRELEDQLRQPRKP